MSMGCVPRLEKHVISPATKARSGQIRFSPEGLELSIERMIGWTNLRPSSCTGEEVGLKREKVGVWVRVTNNAVTVNELFIPMRQRWR
ncbi:hypothetical protein WAI453_008106 [Rhynchosporium graminicola]